MAAVDAVQRSQQSSVQTKLVYWGNYCVLFREVRIREVRTKGVETEFNRTDWVVKAQRSTNEPSSQGPYLGRRLLYVLLVFQKIFVAEQIEFQRCVLIERDQSGDASFEGGSKSFLVIADAQPASSPPRAKEVVAAKWASITRVDTNGGQPLTLRWTVQFLFLIYSIKFLNFWRALF